MIFYKKCLFISSTLLIVGLALLIFGVFIFDRVIRSQAIEGALMTEETADLWAYVPGKSKVQICKDHFFYTIENLKTVFFKNEKVVAQEIAPIRILEFDEMINHTYSEDKSTVDYRYFVYHKDATEEEIEKQKQTVDTFNLVSLGVWYQAKNAKKSQVALKAMYTIYQALTTDMYYGAVQTAMSQIHNNSTAYLSKFPEEYFTSDFKLKNLTFDPYYGMFTNNNAFFAKAVLTHPSQDSRFLMDYFGLVNLEVEYLKQQFLDDVKTPFKNYTSIDLAVRQWLDLSTAKDTVAKLNITTPGYIEYGAYLKYKKDGERSNLTYDQAQKLFFEFNDIGRKDRIDDSHCLINKVNLEIICDKLNREDAIKFINEQLLINNLGESENIYDYINYISGEMAFNLKNNGTPAIGALADFLSQGLAQTYTTMGWDVLFALLSHNSYVDYFKKVPCEEVVHTLASFLDAASICANPKLDTSIYKNVITWIKGLLYKDNELKNLLNLTEPIYENLTKDDSLFVLKMVSYFSEIQTQYDLPGNYKATSLIKLAANQVASGAVLLTNDEFSSNSIFNNKMVTADNYRSEPEYNNFCNQFGCQNLLDKSKFMDIVNYDNLFASRWISDVFIKHYNPAHETFTPIDEIFYSSDFIRYLRYMMATQVLNLFITRPIKDLLWGYEDDLLKMLKNDVPYFLGGDPTLETQFSLLNNMTHIPDEKNIWRMYTGVGDPILTRGYIRTLGQNDSIIRMREPYFDGENITNVYRNPWKKDITVNGTDGTTMFPNITKDSNLWGYLPDLYRCGGFDFYGEKTFNKLKVLRFTLKNQTIQNSTINPDNDAFYSYKYNGFGNMTSTQKAPMFASKAYYYQCDNVEFPEIKVANYTHDESSDPDDVNLYKESWADVEPYTGAILRATQKLLISALLEKDELFDVDDKFVPIYYLFRSGNYTEESTIIVLGDLITGFAIELIMKALGVCLTTLSIALIAFSIIQMKFFAKQRGSSTVSAQSEELLSQ